MVQKRWHKVLDPWAHAPAWAKDLAQTVAINFDGIIRMEKTVMALRDVVDDLETQVKAMTDAESAAEATFIKLAEEIAALRADRTDPQTAQRITDMATALKDRAARLAAAVVMGTPADAPVDTPVSTMDGGEQPETTKAGKAGKSATT